MLRCVCFRCRRLLVDEWDPTMQVVEHDDGSFDSQARLSGLLVPAGQADLYKETHGPSRFDQILKMSRRVKTCLLRADSTGASFVGCGFEQPTYYLTPSMRIRIHFADGTATDSVIDEVRAIHDILRHISDQVTIPCMSLDPQGRVPYGYGPQYSKARMAADHGAARATDMRPPSDPSQGHGRRRRPHAQTARDRGRVHVAPKRSRRNKQE